MKIKSEFYGFSLIQMEKVGDGTRPHPVGGAGRVKEWQASQSEGRTRGALRDAVTATGDGTCERCFVLGRHQTVKDAYVVWEWGTDFKVNAAHFLSERDAMAELQGRVDQARAKFNEKEGT